MEIVPDPTLEKNRGLFNRGDGRNWRLVALLYIVTLEVVVGFKVPLATKESKFTR